ncbi:MAG: hypothetical protein SF028_08885 [Candidatus Sumerlaeia bacterium]|nr:hypothetical protein [Candidatus Sumerlaeia bacterium]
MAESVIALIIRPEEDDADSAGVFVEVRLDGTMREFVLDTGAGGTTLALDPFTESLPVVRMRSSGGVFQRIEDDRVALGRLCIGPIERYGIEVARSRRPGTRSLLGMDVLGRHRLAFDFAAARCEVDQPLPWQGIEAALDLVVGSAGHPYVDIAFEGANASAVWDTGAGVTVVDARFIAEHPESFQSVGASTGTDSTGARLETPVCLMAASRIGGLDFPPHRVVSVDLTVLNQGTDRRTDMILGWPTLSKARWVFDFPARRWGLAPPTASPPP